MMVLKFEKCKKLENKSYLSISFRREEDNVKLPSTCDSSLRSKEVAMSDEKF